MIRILLVEDDPMVAELNRLYVSRLEGFRVAATARNGAEAMAELERQPVDLVLLDVFMAGPSGLELLSELRARGLPVEVILVTAARDTRTIARALQLGAVDYLIKPFEFERLQQALERFRERHRLVHGAETLSQSELDQTLESRPAGARSPLPKGLDRATLARVLEAIEVRGGEPWFTSEDIAQAIGLSRVTVRKYVEFLCEVKALRMELEYGGVGRPVHRFRLRPGHRDEVRRFL